MDTADLSLQQFLISELQCESVQSGIVSLEALLGWQSNLPREIPTGERREIQGVKLKSETYSHFKLRSNDCASFEIVKETIRRYLREAGYDVTCDYESECRYILEATQAHDTVQISCKFNEPNVIDILVV